MSQKAEKYARNMERRVAKLEGRVDRINMDVTSHGVRLSTAEELTKAMGLSTIFVRDADFEVCEKRLGPGGVVTVEDRRTERAARRKRAARRRRLLLAAVLVVIALVCLLFATTGEAADNGGQAAQEPVTIVAPIIAPDHVPTAPETDTAGEDPLEAEKIEEALLAQGYFSDAVPLPYDWQDIMRTACAEYGCPYPFALATADWETRGTFNMDAVGAVGEVGIMQLNPGPDGAYHADLQAATGQDPTTPAGNIVCGVYLLGQYLEKYEDPAKAAMAYNMGEGGARKAWAAGITSTEYSAAVLEATKKWECLVNAWGGT